MYPPFLKQIQPITLPNYEISYGDSGKIKPMSLRTPALPGVVFRHICGRCKPAAESVTLAVKV